MNVTSMTKCLKDYKDATNETIALYSMSSVQCARELYARCLVNSFPRMENSKILCIAGDLLPKQYQTKSITDYLVLLLLFLCYIYPL